MSTRGKITLAVCALAFLAAALFIVKMAGSPSYSTVMTGLDPTKSTQVGAALDAQGIGWELQNGGTALAVDKGKVAQARAALAAKGLNSATQPGFELLDKQKLGASNLQQQIAYQRGLEGQIAQTIGQIQGVQGAQVHLSMPKDDLFADEARPATAAVLLGGDGSALDPGAVRGIANLVASSVPGLKTSAVTITDGTGQMLWPGADGGTADAGGVPSKPAAEARYDAQLEAQLGALLSRTLGTDKAQVQVHSDLNVDKTNEDSVTYAKTGTPLTQVEDNETLTGKGGGTGGTTGTAGNVPSYANTQTAGSNSSSNYKHTKTQTDFGVDKTVARTVKAPGTVNKLDVAVLVDKNAKIPAADLAALKSTISSAAGLNSKRGDTINVSQVAFAKLPAAKAAGGLIPPAFSGILKGVGIGVAALLFLFFITRHLRKREGDELMDEPSWLRQLEAARPAQMLQMPAPPMGKEPTVVMSSVATEDPRRQALEHVIANDPERVASHLRSWITEDNK